MHCWFSKHAKNSYTNPTFVGVNNKVNVSPLHRTKIAVIIAATLQWIQIADPNFRTQNLSKHTLNMHSYLWGMSNTVVSFILVQVNHNHLYRLVYRIWASESIIYILILFNNCIKNRVKLPVCLNFGAFYHIKKLSILW